MRVLVTGARGFVGRNLCCALKNIRDGKDRREKYSGLLPLEVMEYDIDSTPGELDDCCSRADFVFNLAGVNRPKEQSEFMEGNFGFASTLLDALERHGNTCPVMLSSSAQASLSGRFEGSVYGESKLAGEGLFREYSGRTGAPVLIYRFPNLYGKWCRPRYNSAVATFCHNIARGLPIRIDNPSAEVRLVYIDDVVAELLRFLRDPGQGARLLDAAPVHATTVGELARQIEAFKDVRTSLVTERVGTGLVRALYATYVSFLPPQAFSYGVPKYGDARGVFVEMLKTPDCGQFSFFTAHPGITRGGHYHHTKTEKFLVIKGRARYRFRHLLTDEVFEVDSHGDEPLIVETIPGWAHDITNIGDDELVVMLWANEIFDRQKPDTVASPVL